MMRNGITLLLVFGLCAGPAWSQAISVPAGTTVYGELDQRVTSKKKQTSVGDIIRAKVWRNVEVDGRKVIEAGAPMIVRVSHVKKAKVAGIKGALELEAVSVRGVDGKDILLDGGYDKSGHGRKALSITLGLVVAWPLIFIKGKQAVLETGTVFDTSVQADTQVAAGSRRTIRIGGGDSEGLSVEVLYDDMSPDGEDKVLPVKLRLCGSEVTEAAVVSVNEDEIKAIPVVLAEEPESDEESGCTTVRGSIDLKALGKLFSKGINRFVIAVGGAQAEVVLDIEL